MTPEPVAEWRADVAYTGGAMIVLAGVGTALLIVAVQVIGYLDTAHWESFSVVDGLVELGNEWAVYPDRAFGLWEILHATPASGACFFGGIFGAWFWGSLWVPDNA